MKFLLGLCVLFFVSNAEVVAGTILSSVSCAGVVFAVENLDSRRFEERRGNEICTTFLNDKKIKKVSILLHFSDFPGIDGEQLILSREQGDAFGMLPAFIDLDKKRKKFSFNPDSFAGAIDSLPMYSERMRMMRPNGEGLEMSQSFKCHNSSDGVMLISETVFLNKAKNKKWTEGYFSFFKSGYFSVSYWSPAFLVESAAELDRFNRMVAIFMSMKSSVAHGSTHSQISISCI